FVFQTSEGSVIRLTDVIITDKVACGIISIGKITEKGGKVIMDENNAKIVNNGIMLTTAPCNGQSYMIPIHSVNVEHQRHGHHGTAHHTGPCERTQNPRCHQGEGLR